MSAFTIHRVNPKQWMNVLKEWMHGARDPEKEWMKRILMKEDELWRHYSPPPLPRNNSCGHQQYTHQHVSPERVLNDLLRARLSRSRMIWLLAHSLPPSPLPAESSTGDIHTGRLTRGTICWGEGGRKGGGGEEPNSGPQESLVLYKSFNTLLSLTCSSCSICVSITEKKYMVLSYFSSKGWEKEWNIEE